MSAGPLITLVCALPSEARPLLDYYQLTAVAEKPFRIYAKDQLRLVISGLGCDASATAVGYCAGTQLPRRGDIWLNVGIAGHRDLALGTALLGARIGRAHSPTSWYPSVLFDNPLPLVRVVSFEQPVTDYPAAMCCDMEAAGFMAAATRVSAGDLVHVIKIVSDNSSSGLEQIDRPYVEQLVGAQLAAIDAVLNGLRRSALVWPAPLSAGAAQAILQRWHFTHTQRLQLARQLQRICTLAPDTVWAEAALEQCRSAAEVLEQAAHEITRLSPRFTA